MSFILRSLFFSTAVLSIATPCQMASIQPPSPCGVTGQVVDAASGDVLEGVMVAILEQADLRQRTNREGSFSFQELLPGIYTMRLFKGGFVPQDVEIRINGPVSDLTLALSPRDSGSQSLQKDTAVSRRVGGAPVEMESVEVSAKVVRAFDRVSMLAH